MHQLGDNSTFEETPCDDNLELFFCTSRQWVEVCSKSTLPYLIPFEKESTYQFFTSRRQSSCGRPVTSPKPSIRDRAARTDSMNRLHHICYLQRVVVGRHLSNASLVEPAAFRELSQ